MLAYKRWYDTKYFIHKNTTNDLDVCWTTDATQALNVDTMYQNLNIAPYSKAMRFFFDELGFDLNPSLPDSLHLT